MINCDYFFFVQKKAMLRMGKNFTNKEKYARVEEVLNEVINSINKQHYLHLIIIFV